MPTDQCRRLHDDDGLAPVELASEPDQGHSSRMRGTTWLDLAFLVQGQLFAQKKVLRHERRTEAQAQAQEALRIHEEHQQRACEWSNVAEQARVSSHGEGVPLRRKLWSLSIIAAERCDAQSVRMEFLRSTGAVHHCRRSAIWLA